MQYRASNFYTAVMATVAAFALLLSSQASQAFVSVGVSINIAPPALPVYEQPPVPGPGFLWAPGYWAWGDGDYYWVPGTWVEAPQPGYLWTPGYWGWNDGVYVWNGGYWGPHIGFYGGVNYGFGYGGHGYDGGYWDHGAFRYNSAYSNVRGNTQITNVYNKTVINNVTVNHVSYNGGTGGIQARAEPQELAAQHEQHVAPLPAQVQHEQGAQSNPALRAAANHGNPPIAATARPAVFTGQGVVAAHGVALHPPGSTPAAAAGAHATGGAPAMAPHPTALTAAPPHTTGGTGGAAPVVPAAPAKGPPPAARVQHAAPPGGAGHPPANAPHPAEHEPHDKEH
jgi:hypothetical protein